MPGTGATIPPVMVAQDRHCGIEAGAGTRPQCPARAWFAWAVARGAWAIITGEAST
jgi:hypothetical protein